MIFSKASEYATRAIIYIALVDRPGYIPIREISDNLSISFHFLTKIFQNLTEKGILESYRGPKGGILLKQDAKELKLYDIITAIDGDKLFTQCVIGLTGCGEEVPCPFHEKWGPIREQIKIQLMASTVDHFVTDLKNKKLRISSGQNKLDKWLETLAVD